MPLTLFTPGYLMDHNFMGTPVLPAVEAMEALARITQQHYPRFGLDHLRRIRFEKFLYMDPGANHLDAMAEFQPLHDGALQVTLLTKTTPPKASFTRTKIHVRLDFDPGTPQPGSRPIDITAALEGICATVPPEKIYAELVPFGPTFRNIKRPLAISPDGALTHIKTPRRGHHTTNGPGLLGSGYALDAAFHAACVWAQHYRGIVAFPVAIERRTIFTPTLPDRYYLGRVIPATISDGQLLFDLLLLDEDGTMCEVVQGVRMRDVSGGRLHPPDWLHPKGSPDPLEHLAASCRDMAVVELDAVADIAKLALSGLEREKYETMGPRRRKSFLAARLALKRLQRRVKGNDWSTPADRINTVRATSPRPFIDVTASSKRLHCSVSHDRRFALAAVAVQPLGVDVEFISDRILDPMPIFMHPAEEKRVQRSALDDTAAALRIWSVKEAAAKAMDITLADAWERVEVTSVGITRSGLDIDGKAMTAHHADADRHLFTVLMIKGDTDNG
jgi:phosphopantetheinyl transferase